MRTFKALSLSLVMALTSLAGAGCVLRTRGTVAYTVEADPPPPRHVYVASRPGSVWVDGYWYWGGADWVWMDGYYIDERPGYVWIQGSWVGRSWHPGYWRVGGRGTTYVRGGGNVYVRGNGGVHGATVIRGRSGGTVHGGGTVQGRGHYETRDRGGDDHHKGNRDHRGN